MLKRRCPFIGLSGDPDTVVAFASLRNCCNRVEEPEPIRLSYQNSHCFTFDHRHCPLLLEESPAVLPPHIAAIPARKRAVIIVGSVASLFVILILFAGLFGWWQPVEAVDQDPGPDPLVSEPAENPGLQQVFPESLTPTNSSSGVPTALDAAMTETLLPSVTVAEPVIPATEEVKPPPATQVLPTLVSTTCGAPAGWGIYIVKVGDTLSSIAAAQGVSISQLQNANCLTSAAVYVGQRLYVPYPSPATLAPTWTATRAASATTAFTNTPVPSSTSMPTQQPTATQPPVLPTETLSVPTNTPIPLPTNPPAPTATPTPISLPVTATP